METKGSFTSSVVKRDKKKQIQNKIISAAKSVADIVRTTLGPKSMLKMLLDEQGGIVLTNDGNAILRELNIGHPASKFIITLSRAQEENVGDGTTSVVILASEILLVSEPFLDKDLHPNLISKAYKRALQFAINIIENIASPVDIDNRNQMIDIINCSVVTKFSNRFGNLVAEMALEAIKTISSFKESLDNSSKYIDIKRLVKIEKIPGDGIEDCQVLRGVMFNKDVINPGRMRRKILKPRIILLDCPIEYKKGENMINVEISQEKDFAILLKMEEDWIKKECMNLLSFKPDVIITEKGIADLAIYYLQKGGVSLIRRIRKTDNNRISKACGATIIHRSEHIKETDIGTSANIFEVRKIGEDFYSFITDCKDPKACTILLRGASKDLLNEIERNLLDAMGVARNLIIQPSILPGGGAVEMEISRRLADDSRMQGVDQWPYLAFGLALEVIPRTLAQNSGVNVIRTITKLRAKHSKPGNSHWGINGETGSIMDMQELGVWEPLLVKVQTIKSAITSACQLMRIDDIVSVISKRNSKDLTEKSDYQDDK